MDGLVALILIFGLLYLCLKDSEADKQREKDLAEYRRKSKLGH